MQIAAIVESLVMVDCYRHRASAVTQELVPELSGRTLVRYSHRWRAWIITVSGGKAGSKFEVCKSVRLKKHERLRLQ